MFWCMDKFIMKYHIYYTYFLLSFFGIAFWKIVINLCLTFIKKHFENKWQKFRVRKVFNERFLEIRNEYDAVFSFKSRIIQIPCNMPEYIIYNNITYFISMSKQNRNLPSSTRNDRKRLNRRCAKAIFIRFAN